MAVKEGMHAVMTSFLKLLFQYINLRGWNKVMKSLSSFSQFESCFHYTLQFLYKYWLWV